MINMLHSHRPRSSRIRDTPVTPSFLILMAKVRHMGYMNTPIARALHSPRPRYRILPLPRITRPGNSNTLSSGLQCHQLRLRRASTATRRLLGKLNHLIAAYHPIPNQHISDLQSGRQYQHPGSLL